FELKVGFDKSAIDSGAVGVIRVSFQEAFEIPDKGGAIAAGIVEGTLQFRLGIRLLRGTVVAGTNRVRGLRRGLLTLLGRRPKRCGLRRVHRRCPIEPAASVFPALRRQWEHPYESRRKLPLRTDESSQREGR